MIESAHQTKPQMVRAALDQILTTLAVGDSLPPERELAARFEVARETVRQALHELLVEGRVERRGRGTVVSRPKIVHPLSLRSYTESVIAYGRTPGRYVVSWEDIDADDRLAEDLAIDPGDRVMLLERVLLVDGEPVGLESTFLPARRFGFLRETYDPTTSLYAAIAATGVTFARATERIETVLAAPRQAALIESNTTMPMLQLIRRTLDADDVPIEVVRSLYRGDRIAFEAQLRR